MIFPNHIEKIRKETCSIEGFSEDGIREILECKYVCFKKVDERTHVLFAGDRRGVYITFENKKGWEKSFGKNWEDTCIFIYKGEYDSVTLIDSFKKRTKYNTLERPSPIIIFFPIKQMEDKDLYS